MHYFDEFYKFINCMSNLLLTQAVSLAYKSAIHAVFMQVKKVYKMYQQAKIQVCRFQCHMFLKPQRLLDILFIRDSKLRRYE